MNSQLIAGAVVGGVVGGLWFFGSRWRWRFVVGFGAALAVQVSAFYLTGDTGWLKFIGTSTVLLLLALLNVPQKRRATGRKAARGGKTPRQSKRRQPRPVVKRRAYR